MNTKIHPKRKLCMCYMYMYVSLYLYFYLYYYLLVECIKCIYLYSEVNI